MVTVIEVAIEVIEAEAIEPAHLLRWRRSRERERRREGDDLDLREGEDPARPLDLRGEEEAAGSPRAGLRLLSAAMTLLPLK